MTGLDEALSMKAAIDSGIMDGDSTEHAVAIVEGVYHYWTAQRHVRWAPGEWLVGLDDEAFAIFWLLVAAAEGIL